MIWGGVALGVALVLAAPAPLALHVGEATLEPALATQADRIVGQLAQVLEVARARLGQPRLDLAHREGLKRRGFSAEQIALANQAYKLLYRRGLKLNEALEAITKLGDDPAIMQFLNSIEKSTRGIIR